MPKRFVVVTKGPTGAIELHSMKEWLRQHPEQSPPNMTADDQNSHQLRDGLRKQGWAVRESEHEVRLLHPEVSVDENLISVMGPDETGDGDGENLDLEEQFEFALESHLRDFIVRNLTTIPVTNKRLRLYVNNSNRNGVEYPTEVGPIDILAVDEKGSFIVFELKLARGPDRAMGQLLRYMGWVKKNLAQNCPVHGVVVAKNIEQKLRYAALLVPNVSLLEYELDFKLRAASLDPIREVEKRL